MNTNLVVLQRKAHKKVVFSNFFDKTATIKYHYCLGSINNKKGRDSTYSY